ncbi:MAG: metallophosphoesterase, partial [Nitrospirota bacterium]|nr:metallophosphoesterase [Nitrospirota bacterium]
MRLFFFVFFLVYGACNFSVFMKAKAALHPGRGAALLLLFFILLMIASPFIVRLSEKAGHETFAAIMAYAGYTWLGIVFLFISASLVIDAYRLLLHAAEMMLKQDMTAASLSARNAFFIPLVLAVGIAVYGYFEARQIQTEHIRIRTSKLPEGVDKLRIVQISDVHLGLIVGEERLKKILEKAEKARPDLLVSTGDLVDAQTCGL